MRTQQIVSQSGELRRLRIDAVPSGEPGGSIHNSKHVLRESHGNLREARPQQFFDVAHPITTYVARRHRDRSAGLLMSRRTLDGGCYHGRMSDGDPLARKMQADAIVERAAQQLQPLLEEAASQLRPFPPFPGAFFTNAVEVNLQGVERPDLGCIVVAEDGNLYELEMKIDFGEELSGNVDPVQARDETLNPLENLHPRDYVILAYNALTQLTELALERGGGVTTTGGHTSE
jgi:hypothetical protein